VQPAAAAAAAAAQSILNNTWVRVRRRLASVLTRFPNAERTCLRFQNCSLNCSDHMVL
jgi:hypothetical protein